MPETFRHHPDGLIYLNELVVLPVDFFLSLEPGYSLPLKATHREYKPDKYHRLYNDESQWDGEFPWSEGDIYLSKATEYQAAWDAAHNPPPPPEPVRPNWQRLTSSLRGTLLFEKVYGVAEAGDSTIATPLMLLTATLNSANPNFNDLQFSLQRLKLNMGDRLTADDITAVNSLLAENNFDIVI